MPNPALVSCLKAASAAINQRTLEQRAAAGVSEVTLPTRDEYFEWLAEAVEAQFQVTERLCGRLTLCDCEPGGCGVRVLCALPLGHEGEHSPRRSAPRA